MEGLYYIIKQAKRFHFTKWDEHELQKCIELLEELSRLELMHLYTSRWISGEKIIKKEITKHLFPDIVGRKEQRIKEMNTDELIVELLDKKGGLVSLARQELMSRYIENTGDDRAKIALAFAQSSIKDSKWIESQLKKELYGNNKK